MAGDTTPVLKSHLAQDRDNNERWLETQMEERWRMMDRNKQKWKKRQGWKERTRSTDTYVHTSLPRASWMWGDSCRAPSPNAHAAQLACNVHLIMAWFLPVNGRPATQQKIWTLITVHDNCHNYKHKYGARARPLIWPCGLHLSSFLFLINSLSKRERAVWDFSDATFEQ